MNLPDDGCILVVKHDCPTCQLIAPLATELSGHGLLAEVLSQDDPMFPAGVDVTDDRELAGSFALDIEVVPTLIRHDGGAESGRVVRAARHSFSNLVDMCPRSA